MSATEAPPLRLRVFVSVALHTGVWEPLGRGWGHGPGPGRERGFSSVTLDGAVMTASRVEARDWERTGLQQALAAADPTEAPPPVLRAVVHDRDIDGSTLVVELEPVAGGPDDLWPRIAGYADAVVAWADPAAQTLLDRRLDEGFQPLPGWPSHGPSSALWAHTTLVCRRAEADPGHACTSDGARRLLPSEVEVVEVPGARVFLGLHGSLCCVDGPTQAARLIGLLDELHGWWTATWSLDQALLGTATTMAGQLSAGRYRALASSADLLADVTTSTGVLRTRLDSFRLGLGGFEWPVWDAAGNRWALSENLEAIERKRVVLAETTSAFRSALDSHHAERLNRLAAMFAVVSALASFVAVVLFLFPDLQDPTGLALRAALLLTAFAVSLAAILWSSRYMLRRARLRRRTT